AVTAGGGRGVGWAARRGGSVTPAGAAAASRIASAERATAVGGPAPKPASRGSPAQGSDPPASAIAISHSFGPDTQRMLAARLHAVFQPASGEARAVRRGSRGPCIYTADPRDRRQP